MGFEELGWHGLWVRALGEGRLGLAILYQKYVVDIIVLVSFVMPLC